MKKVRVAIVGLGHQGKKHLKALTTLQDIGMCQIVGACDISKKNKIFGIPFFKNYLELYELHPEIVVISAPNSFHKQMVLDAFKMGINVIKEKPFAINYDEASIIFKEAKRYKRICAIMQQRQYTDLYRVLKKEIKRSRILEFFYRFSLDDTVKSWKWDIDIAGGGVWLNMGWHGLWLIEKLIGDIRTVNLSSKSGGRRRWDYATDHSSIANIKTKLTQGMVFLSCVNTKSEYLKLKTQKKTIYYERKKIRIFSKRGIKVYHETHTEEQQYILQMKDLLKRVHKGSYDLKCDLSIMRNVQLGIDSNSKI